ncbi:SDR family oxidoreductase [Sphingopyxis alaskensis]|jgi:uncharacterized oxidoreductase|uniref:SDR family oxidoreductase n=1 Tax=Sphingopyxis alaskensis TaxID=117207 RepID=UPI0020408381|nr:SDR family NAD(P)-dependent oxidoreductase [Sphingopyxis alaskensis]MCM3420234.1 SDR family NAD(P)-dependent oxidoreductase [Sphingopyxis alaskensis]
MELAGNTILVTGGASGIGLALAQRFLASGSDVIICGRDGDRLEAARSANPGLHILQADLARQADRERLARSVVDAYPNLNILVNNAGIQRRGRFRDDAAPWADRSAEIAINLEAPIHLASLLLPHLETKLRACIINVTSGLAFIPMVFAPVYAATKAAMHSFSQALRAELADSSVTVVEIIPPAVKTDLGGAGLHDDGVPVDEFADAVMARLATEESEIGHGMSDHFRTATRDQLATLYRRLNGMKD